ncbi:hypothetical protein [Desulfosporosinus sp. BG]|uniref:hypothetical protein n=1 Tax=Desulfosporosinus sp. BG TaxID=1633135 RepID=UPI000857B21D|nr:hypothetical protein [Desulfosporosinus sp. BG]ODA39319.1 Uncharacterized protein DSBG_3923 [Desulfosporosinus sp. BG]
MSSIKNFRVNLLIGLLLIISSIALYCIQYYIFKTPRDTFFYLLQDLGFVPLQVIIVTLVLDKLLTSREKREKLLKLNTVISAFFSELGTAAISLMSGSHLDISDLQGALSVNSEWKEAEFKKASNMVKGFKFHGECTARQLVSLREFLHTYKPYLLRMFDNPNLLEHDAFTEMLWALLHVSEELESRDSLEELPKNDMAHLSNDVMRAYRLLTIEWVCYMKYLKIDYPYLFSLATRKNPFKEKGSVIFE